MERSIIHSLALQLHHRFQDARAELVLSLTRPRAGMRLLDLGGGSGGLAQRLASTTELHVTVADIDDHAEACRAQGFDFVRVDETKPLPFADKSFDLVLCNSVIEHVTLPKEVVVSTYIPEDSWRASAHVNQQRFADEIRRLGRSYFVQTPHRRFPLDVHTWLPFTHWLPHDKLQRLVKVTDRYWIKKCGFADWHLLDEREIMSLFPEGTLHVERFLGLPKSLIVYKRLAD